MNKISNILTALGVYVATSCANASIHDPHSSFLNLRLPDQNELTDSKSRTSLETEQKYLQEVVGKGHGITKENLTNFQLSDWKKNNGFDVAIDIGDLESENIFSNTLEEIFKEWDSSLAGQAPAKNVFMREELSKISVDYFNSGDLGLARRMTCVKQTIDIDADKLSPNFYSTSVKRSLALRGKGAMACYVTNYGSIGGSVADNFSAFPADSEDPNNSQAFATVAMEIWPSAPENKVRFFVFAKSNGPGLDDDLLAYASEGSKEFTPIKLDNGGGHSQPGVCMSCHGGKFERVNSMTTEENTFSVNGAHFLPFDIGAFRFADEDGASAVADLTDIKRKASKKFALLNFWIFDAERRAYGIDSTIPSYLDSTHSFSPRGPREKPITSDSHIDELRIIGDIVFGEHLQKQDYVEPNFSGNEELYHEVYAPYCRGCHIAVDFPLSPPFFTKDLLCRKNKIMPHAEVNLRNLLNESEHVEAITGVSCLPSLLDFESENISGKSLYFHEKLAYSTAVIDVTSTAVQLIDDTMKRTAQTTKELPTVKLIFAHDVDAAHIGSSGGSSSEMINGKLNRLEFQYYLTGNNSITVDFMNGSTVKSKVVITNFNTTYDSLVTENKDKPVQFTHIGKPLFRIANLTDVAKMTGASHVVITLSGSPSTPVEIDEVIVNIDSNYELAVDAGADLLGSTNVTSQYVDSTDKVTYACGDGVSDHQYMHITDEREPIRGLVVGKVLGMPDSKICTGRYYQSTAAFKLQDLNIRSTSSVIIAFDYHIDENAIVHALINPTGGRTDSPVSNLIGLNKAVEKSKVGRYRYEVPSHILDASSFLSLSLHYIPLSFESAGVHFDNFKIYVKN